MQPERSARLVVVYERVSSDKQDISRQAVQRERASADYPQAEIRVLQDDGVSAYKVSIFDRPEGKKLCALIEAGRVEALYADAQDRLSRGRLAEWVNFKALCDDNGTRIVINGRELRADDESDELLAAFEAIGARRESREKSHRVKGGIARELQAGRYLGSRKPYGFDFEGERRERRLIVNAPEAKIIRDMADLYEGGAGDGEIAGRLNERGLPSPSGGTWEKTEVRWILRSPLVKGCVHRRRTAVRPAEVIDGEHEAIIEPERWERLQAIRASRRGSGRRPNGGHVFTHGLLRCPECHAAMRPRTTPKGYAYYECTGRSRRDRPVVCDQSSMDARLLERLILGGILDHVFDLDATRARIEEAGAAERIRAESMIEAAERGIATVERKRARAEADYIDEKLSAERYESIAARLDEEARQADAHAAELREAAAAVEQQAADIDAQREVMTRLHAVQQVIAGQPDSIEHVQPLREALHQTFERIYLARNSNGALLVIPVPRHDVIRGEGAEVEFELDDKRILRGRRLTLSRIPLPDGLSNKEETSSGLSAGTNALLKLGATPLTSAADVLASYGLEREAPQDRGGLLDLLPATADELVRKTGCPSSEIAQALVELELAGSVAAFDGIYRVQ